LIAPTKNTSSVNGKRRKTYKIIIDMNRIGKSNRSKERRQWQAKMMAKHGRGEYCEWYEGCADRFAIANAHRVKKIDILTELEWVDGRAHLCQKHHNWVEYGDRENPGTHERMWQLVNQCMEAAGRFVPRQKGRYED